MKKICKKIIVLGTFTLFCSSSVLAADFLSVTADNANVRTGPGLNYPVAMELFQGYPLKVLKTQGEWYKIIDYEKDSGWIHNSIVKDRDTVIVNARKSLNMRSGPSTNSPVIADVERGVVLQKLDTKGKWTKVKHTSGTEGWIYSSLLWP
ncbi:SH3 domain-containing protein [Desulforhopalus singaporensis]|uniref:SH3-like domain-containing protein n=1 Tax=Desulforhopalus singaporensis TaxID=91360 RepID=A0A1H0QJL5_9BACT|nr:SH3 domain-containing protein [Desulforhopalus singaporensis]SDP16939.1 SH3-like domain-containing protein [Desulforhopalus singaporensis]